MNLTYLGSFDDRSVAYSRNNTLNINSLNDILFAELLFSTNSQIVINDGYLIHSPILIEALTKKPPKGKSLKDFHYEQSPLFSMLRNGRVMVLGRENSFMGAVERMLREDNESYNKIKERKDWQKTIDILDRDLKNCFMDWPTKNTSYGFIKLMQQLFEKGPEKLGLKIKSHLFEEIALEFTKKVDENPNSPRDKWEKIVKQHSDYKNELMAIANRAYHYNFGMCLKADFPERGDVKVHSIASNLFTERTETSLSKRDVKLLDFALPKDFSINDKFIHVLCQPGRLRDMHDLFVSSYKDYMGGHIEPDELVKIQNDFRKLIGSEARRLHRSSSNQMACWSIGFALSGGFACYHWHEDPVVNLVTTILGATPGGISIIQDQRRYRGKGTIIPFETENILLDNLTLSKEKAVNHAKKLPLFVREDANSPNK